LWDLLPLGTGVYFTAGIGDEQHGLFGLLLKTKSSPIEIRKLRQQYSDLIKNKKPQRVSPLRLCFSSGSPSYRG
jgi:hypothetical protein